MSIKERISKLKDLKRLDPVKNIILLMKYFGWSLSDIEKLSIPAYFILVEKVNEIEKEAKEKSQGKKDGHRKTPSRR